MTTLNISSFIWGIADDVLRDLYVRGKYRDVILPMTVIRRLDAVLEPTKDEVRAAKERLDAAGITNQDQALRQASGEAFYNASPSDSATLHPAASHNACGPTSRRTSTASRPTSKRSWTNSSFATRFPR